jgi:predicted dehydrogenase
MSNNALSRRNFLSTAGTAIAGSILMEAPAFGSVPDKTLAKTRVALVGTGIRGLTMWGKNVLNNYKDQVEYVGLCDINSGRVDFAKKFLGLQCNTYSDFEKMMKETKPELLIVTTPDFIHHEFIIKGMEMGANIITEKPMTTDEKKCQEIIDAEKRTGKKVIVTFNYRYSPHRAKIYEHLRKGSIGELTSVDFHWYLDNSHGADYFRRWHRLKEKSGSLWVHKATHHFDLLNWWIDSDPEEVFARSTLQFYGKNHPFRSTNCRPCEHKNKCTHYWDITKNSLLEDLYVKNEKHDGYLRDGCVWKEDINIYDTMSATIQYKNKVHVSYSLIAYAPYEGYRIAFNGTEGRIDAWIQESNPTDDRNYDEIVLFRNFKQREYFKIPIADGHGGGDKLLLDQIFLKNIPDPLRQSAGIRDGALSVLIGIAATKSSETGQPVKIKDLTSIIPQEKKT